MEPIDPIKFITNRSSGKMGVAVARAAASRGAEVTLVYGPGTENPPPDVKVVRVRTTQEMRDAFTNELGPDTAIVVSAAAPQDFVVDKPFEKKLKHSQPTTLRLTPAPRVLSGVRDRAPKAFLVGFKAEHEVSDDELLAAAKAKLEEGLDMVVANDVGRLGAGFEGDTNEIILVTRDGHKNMRGTKSEIAQEVLDSAVAHQK